MASRKTWEPKAFPVRDPRSPSQQQGRVVNPVRTLKFAGRGESNIVNTQKFQKGTNGPNGVGPVSDRGGRGGR